MSSSKKRTFSGVNDYTEMDDDWIDEVITEDALYVRNAKGDKLTQTLEYLVNTWPPLNDEDVSTVVSSMLAKKRRTETKPELEQQEQEVSKKVNYFANKLEYKIMEEIAAKALSVRTAEGEELTNTLQFLINTWPPLQDQDVSTVLSSILAKKSTTTDAHIEKLETTISQLQEKIEELTEIDQEQVWIIDNLTQREKELQLKCSTLENDLEKLQKK